MYKDKGVIMAFDLNVALNNPTYAYNAWINATQLGNTIKISPEDLAALEEQYSSDLAAWLEKYQEYDSTEYDVPDFDPTNFEDDYAAGAGSADYGAGYDWQSGASLGASALNILGGETLLQGAADAGKAVVEEVATEVTKEVAADVAEDIAATTVEKVGEFIASDGSKWIEVSVAGNDAVLVDPKVYAQYQQTGDASLLGDIAGVEELDAATVTATKPDTALADIEEQKKNADKSWMIQAPLSAVIAAVYWATRPNIDEAKTLDELATIMQNGSTEMQASITRMIELSQGAAEAAALAGQASADFADFMKVLEEGLGTKQEKLEAAYQQKAQLEQALKETEKGIKPLQDNINEKLAIIEQKIANGEQPTPQEQAQIDALKAQLASLNAPIDGLLADIATINGVIEGLEAEIAADLAGIEGQKDAGAAVAAEHNATILANSEEMVTHGENITYQQGVVAQAEAQDKGVLISIISEIASQGGNIYSAVKAAVSAFRSIPLFGWFAGAMGALATVAAAGSTVAVVDQSVAMAKVIGEMGDRKDLTTEIEGATTQFEVSTGQHLESFDSGILSENTILEYEVEDGGETA